MLGEPNPKQWDRYAENNCVFHYRLPHSYQYMRNWNRGYMEWAQRMRIRRWGDPVIIHLYSEVLQRFRLAGEGKWPGRQPPERLRERVRKYFDPLPFYYAPLEAQVTDLEKYPLAAITQRPMAMYHSWDSQNAWLRQIHGHNYLFVNPRTARAAGDRGRRLDVGRIALGQGALPVPRQRGGRARHGVDLERDRQAARAPGTSRPTPTRRPRASCSTT